MPVFFFSDAPNSPRSSAVLNPVSVTPTVAWPSSEYPWPLHSPAASAMRASKLGASLSDRSCKLDDSAVALHCACRR